MGGWRDILALVYPWRSSRTEATRPLRAAAGQTFVAAAVAARTWHATAAAGQTFVDGAEAGRAGN